MWCVGSGGVAVCGEWCVKWWCSVVCDGMVVCGVKWSYDVWGVMEWCGVKWWCGVCGVVCEVVVVECGV